MDALSYVISAYKLIANDPILPSLYYIAQPGKHSGVIRLNGGHAMAKLIYQVRDLARVHHYSVLDRRSMFNDRSGWYSQS